MATLESLIGKPLHLCSDEELEEIVMRGRLAREDEMEGSRTKRSVKVKAEKVAKASALLVNPDDFD